MFLLGRKDEERECGVGRQRKKQILPVEHGPDTQVCDVFLSKMMSDCLSLQKSMCPQFLRVSWIFKSFPGKMGDVSKSLRI